MKIVGLTGGIGSGKTTVAKMFSELGVPVYNSDKEAKKLMQSSKKVREGIINLFGPNAYQGKKLNKTYISSKVFKDTQLLQKLNAIVHPAVREDFLNWASELKNPYVIQETALIFENRMQDFYDVTILVTAPQAIRLERVMLRDDASEEKIQDRMKHQLDDSEKIGMADFIIENLDLQKTTQKVEAINRALLDNS